MLLPPVTLKLEGGLGNQLFEFAAGFYLASKLGVGLLVDQYSIPISTKHEERDSGIQEFRFELPSKESLIVFQDSLPSSTNIFVSRKVEHYRRFLMKMRMIRNNPFSLPVFRETNDQNIWSELKKIDCPVRLHGNFQSWKVVEEAARIGFSRKFELRKVSKAVLDFLQFLNPKDSAFVHFRLGQDAQNNRHFSQPTMNYYHHAIKAIESRMKLRDVYAVSDNWEVFRLNFMPELGRSIKYLDFPEIFTPSEKLFILSQFGGVVCANSTFCGWAAWNIYNHGGTVVVPVPYSNGPVPGSRDFPKSWIKLEKVSGRAQGDSTIL